MFGRMVWMGMLTGALAVACNDDEDRMRDERSAGKAGASAAGATTNAGDSSHGGDAEAEAGTDTGAKAGTDTGGSAGTATGGKAGTDAGGSSDTAGSNAGTDDGGSSGTTTGGSAGNATGGVAGDASVPVQCKLGPEVYNDESPRASSTTPCGWLGDLSATPGFALDIGHGGALLGKTATRLPSYNRSRWELWDLQARSILKIGHDPKLPPWDEHNGQPAPRPPVLSDTHLAALASTDGSAYKLEIASALDGNVVAAVTMPGLTQLSQFGFASDDSYLWATTKQGVSAWSTDGQLLAKASGDYEEARVSAVPGELRIAFPSRDVIEKISTVTGDSTLSPAFEGTFHSWFVAGTRFLTTTSNTVRVYSGATATQENLFTVATLQKLTGQGDHVWTYEKYRFDLYALSDPSAPAETLQSDFWDAVFPAGNRIGVVKYGVPKIDIIELGPTIIRRSVDVPSHYNHSFIADKAGNWAIASNNGALFESTDLTHSLSCGAILSIARADDGTTAVATAAGGIHLFKITDDSRQYLRTIPFPSGHVELSRDGRVLAASADLGNYQYQRTARFASSACQAETKSRPGRTASPARRGTHIFLVSACPLEATVSATKLAYLTALRTSGHTRNSYEVWTIP